MFGLSFTGTALVVAAGALLLGQRELPIIARHAGYIVGRCATMIKESQQIFQSVNETSEIQQLQKEINKSMKELHAIKNELRENSQILDSLNVLRFPHTLLGEPPAKEDASEKVKYMETKPESSSQSVHVFPWLKKDGSIDLEKYSQLTPDQQMAWQILSSTMATRQGVHSSKDRQKSKEERDSNGRQPKDFVRDENAGNTKD